MIFLAIGGAFLVGMLGGAIVTAVIVLKNDYVSLLW